MKGGKIFMNLQRKSKGFTIIEVVLVLAIAGLIFLMVFIALPALQRSQRDAQRKNDLSRAMTALASYTSNNRGALPSATDWAAFNTNYLQAGGDSFKDPSGENYSFKVNDAVSSGASSALSVSFDPAKPIILVSVGAVCGEGETITAGQGSRKVALQMKLEGGGITCQNN
jgi:prepilin-type N-terminal cleavage/methylation domain-containing protein